MMLKLQKIPKHEKIDETPVNQASDWAPTTSPPQSSSSLGSSPPNYHHELIVAPDGWCSARELPVAHHRHIIVVV